MFGSVESATTSDLLTRLSGSVDELQNLALTSLSDDDLLAVLRDLETEKRRLATADHRLIAEIGSRGLAREHGCKDTATLLRQLLRVTPHQASARVRAAADMGPRRGLTGEMLPPVFGRVAAAQAAGSISVAHARIVTGTVDALPAAVQAEHDQSVETFLLEQARSSTRSCSPRSRTGSATPSTPTAPAPPNATGTAAASCGSPDAATGPATCTAS